MKVLSTIGLCVMLCIASSVRADLLVYVDVDIEKPGVQSERTVAAGETFPIHILVGEDGIGEGASTFDRIVIGVYFNDAGEMLSVTNDRRPHAGDMANNSETTRDALGGTKAFAMEELTLLPDEKAFPKGFRSTAGQAGLEDKEHPFRITKNDLKILAAGKLNAGFTAELPGTSTILATAPQDSKGVTFEGKDVKVRYIPATITVVESKAALAAKLLIESSESPAEALRLVEAAQLKMKSKQKKE